MSVAEIVIAFLPIITFLVIMKLMDSFKLLKSRDVGWAIAVGCVVALAALFFHRDVISLFDISFETFTRFISPFSEELLKFIFVIYVIRTYKVGFMVDAAILGFAVGAGFAIVENIYYMSYLTDAGILTWFVRGFGTAVLHGGTTAIAAVISKDLSDRKKWPLGLIFLPGLLTAVLIHTLFNMFLLPPITMALLVFMVLPVLFFITFKQSEKNTREWLGTGLDSDMEMLQILMSGNIRDSRIGEYLNSIGSKFSPVIVGDIICYLRLYLELSIEVKGMLILKENGIEPPILPQVKARLEELDYLDSQIGKTGKIAIQPLLKLSNTDLWQISMMKQNAV